MTLRSLKKKKKEAPLRFRLLSTKNNGNTEQASGPSVPEPRDALSRPGVFRRGGGSLPKSSPRLGPTKESAGRNGTWDAGARSVLTGGSRTEIEKESHIAG